MTEDTTPAEPTWTPTEPHADIETWVFQALGAASMCWEETPHGVFDSTRAKSIGDALVARIRRYVLADDSQREDTAPAEADCKHCGERTEMRSFAKGDTTNGRIHVITGLFTCQSSEVEYGHVAEMQSEPCGRTCIGRQRGAKS